MSFIGWYALAGIVMLLPSVVFMHRKISKGDGFFGYLTIVSGIIFVYILLPIVAPIVFIIIGMVMSGGLRSGRIGNIVREVEKRVKAATKGEKSKAEVKGKN